MALITAYGRAVRERKKPADVGLAHDRVVEALAAAGVGQRFGVLVTRYENANRAQADPSLSHDDRLAAGIKADELAAELETAVRQALGEAA